MVRFVFKFLCVFYVAVIVNPSSLSNNFDNNSKFSKVHGSDSRKHATEQKKYHEREAKVNDSEMDKILANVTEKVTHLKHMYGENKYRTFLPKLDKIIYEYNTQRYNTYKPQTKKMTTSVTTTEDADFLGTAQIEELLNDIKARAIQMVAEQNPAVTDIITNTVTEATFEADPILTHLEVSSPGFALTTFVFLNNIENIDKRTANDSNVVLISNKKDKHNLYARSIKEDAFTIAQNVEDMLQKELKSVYKKVKDKVSKDFHKEVKQAKTSLKYKSTKMMDKVTKTITGGRKTHLTTTKPTTKFRHNRGNKTTKKMKKTTKHRESTTSTPTIDDFAMLTLYEQILAKTHEDNVMKMVTTNKKRKIDEIVRLSKRNPETLTDLSLKEDIKRIYDDGESIPDVDYNHDATVPEPSNDYSSDSNIKAKVTEEATESAPLEDTSYEGLSDKIAFKDYVNGYKSYLDFQKEQGSSNFSNLIKYQAHRHHKVDDIGKFILNKIPQIPVRKKRYFFDDSDMDEQDISTKSDDSWFKKHFYMFIDKGPPKKYHTSETVEFKDVTEARRVGYTTDRIERPGLTEISIVSQNEAQPAEINLDELSKVLENCKAAAGIKSFKSDNIDTTPESEQNRLEEGGIAFKIYKPHIIDKFFSKSRRYPAEENEKYIEQTLKYDDDDNFLFNSDVNRYRRNAKNREKTTEKEVNTISTQIPVLNKQDNVKSDKTKSSNSKKDGFVSIVTQPTAVVNLFKAKVQESKIKKLLSKLHFHKINKKKMKEKRHCTRVQRFNPLKSLKDMFLPKPDERVLSPNAQQDYDMITSHIDTFKPVKYDRIPSIEELRNQVPNISGDFVPNQPEAVTNPDIEWTAKDDVKHNKILAATDPSVGTENYPITSSSRPLQWTQAKTKKPQNIFNFKEDFAVMDDIMNIKVKTLPKIEEIFTVSPVTIDDIRNEINMIQIKLSTVNDQQFNQRTVPKYTMKKKSYDILNSDIDRESNDEIKTKLKRITDDNTTKPENKLVDAEVNPIADKPKLVNFLDDDSYLNVNRQLYPHQGSGKRTPFFKYNNKFRKNLITSNPLIGVTLKNLNNFKEPPIIAMKNNVDIIRRYQTYPDYFSDLVTWNSDILNNNKDLNPTWQDILKGIQSDQEFTTPNVIDMQNELHEMKKYLINNGISLEQAKLKEAAKLNPDLSLKLVAKTDGTNLAVNNKEITIDPLDFDKDYNVQRNELKKYSPVKSQDIIDILNKLYAKKPNESMNGVKRLMAFRKPNINNGPITDHGGDSRKFMIHSFAPKKISKNSLKSTSSKNKLAHPIAKQNKQPKQYYNTPLPMKNEQFEKFLKENQLDVEYVTTPIVLLPTIAEARHSKIKPQAKTKQDNMNIQNPKDKTTGHDIEEVIDKSYPETQLEYLNDMEQDLLNDYKEIESVRRKRSSMPDYRTFTDDALIGKDKYEKFKNKINNIFEKNAENSLGMINYNTVSKPNEVEVTIIDFDEMDKKQENGKLVSNPFQKLINVDPTTKEDTTLTNTDIQNLMVNLPKEKPQFLNRNLQIKNGENEVDPINDAQIRSIDDSKAKDEVTSMNLIQFPNELSAKCKDKNGNLPKRVQISSHCYKYDVLYNVPNIKATEDVIEVTAPAVRDFNKKRFIDSNWKENIDSEIEVIKIVDIVKAVDEYTRPDITFHVNLPVYYAPNPDIDVTEDCPINKPSWTDLILKYISGIALIEMLNKMGVLKGGPNFTEGLNVNFDRVKVFSADGVKEDSLKKSRVERAAKTTTKRYTYSQIIHFTRDMKKTRKKRTFTLLPIIKEKLMLFAKTKSASVNSTKPKESSTKSLNAINDNSTMKVATIKDTLAMEDGETTKGTETDSKQSEYHYDNILIDYKGDLGAAKEENKKADETTMTQLFVTMNKQMNKAKEITKPIDNEGVYIEEVYDDQVYYEAGTKKNKAVTKTKRIDFNENSKMYTDLNINNKPKRDVNGETFTAKDVAALEIIVDLMKNPLMHGENEPVNIFSPNNFLAQVTKPRKMANEKMDHVTNSIQVHIAIPYDIPDKKRSADILKLRKVFTAKLATPVDLEYQIHSINDNTATTAMKSESDYGFSPGMYLLVDNSKGSFALKPVKGSPMRVRNVEEGTDKVKDQTKADKAPLSKEFISAINKHLIQLYENLTAANEGKTKMHNVTRREVSWDRVKKFFGHDRVCNCKCKANKTICKACAASDEVINELSFEFDNLAKYINDHCTEIQTFFWMNPSGGKVLRDLVHKIDKSVNDYYKRVRGKCRGRTCKTFATYMDKRDFDNIKKVKIEKSNIGETLINDLKSLQNNIDISLNCIPYRETLKVKGVKLVNAASNCIASKPINKRSSNNEKQHIKNVYSLDNISVNIICKPDSSTLNTSPMSYIDTPITESENIILDYDTNKRNSMRNSLKELFVRKRKPKLDKHFTYCIKHVTTADNFKKREASYEQVESPLIADTGGSFWYDYLNKGNEVDKDNRKPKVGISDVQTNTEATPTTVLDTIKITESFKDKLISMYTRKGQEVSTTDTSTEESLRYNINELFKLFSTITDVEAVKKTFTDPTIVSNRNVTKKHRTKKIKTKKLNKLHKASKAKMHHKHKTKTKMTTDIPTTIYNTTNATSIGTTKLNAIKATTEVPKSTTSTFDYFPVEEISDSLKEVTYIQTKTAHKQTTKKHFFNKIKSATLNFISNIGKGNRVLDLKNLKSTKADNDDGQVKGHNSGIRDFTMDARKSSDTDINVISEITTKINPTILIITSEDTVTTTKYNTKDKFNKYRNILLALLNYESSKLDKEKQNIKEDMIDKKMHNKAELVENVSQGDESEYSQIRIKMKTMQTTKAPDIDYDIIRGLKTIGSTPAPPGLKMEPGMFDWISHKIGIKVLPEEKVAPESIKSSKQHNVKIKGKGKVNSRSTHFEEADPCETANVVVNNPNLPSNGIKFFKDHIERKYMRRRKRNRRTHAKIDNLKEDKINEIKERQDEINKRTFLQKATVRSSIKTAQKAEFDSYIRGDNGIYRMKRNGAHNEETIVRNVEGQRFDQVYRKDDKLTKKYHPRKVRIEFDNDMRHDLRTQRRMDKRSSNDGIKKTSANNIIVWMQHATIGIILVTVTSFYVFSAVFATIVNWIFRR